MMDTLNQPCCRRALDFTALAALLFTLFFTFLLTNDVQAASRGQTDPAPADEKPLRFTQVAAGDDHACGRLEDGGVYCWGSNANDQLGDGSGRDSAVAIPVKKLESGAVQLAAGAHATCALMEDGSAQCWPQSWEQTAPYTPKGLARDVKALAGGDWHFCAIVGEEVLCWGSNGNGQLGDGTTGDQEELVKVQGLAGAPLALAAGANHTCAVVAGGTVQCWGANAYGQLGNGATEDSASPVAADGLAGPAAAVAAGENHTCALLETGDVQCWGINAGLVDDPSAWSIAEPVTIGGLPGEVTDLGAGGYTTCAVAAGQAACWGMNNASGQLGAGTGQDEKGPVIISGLEGDAVGVSIGAEFACAALADGSIQCWGYNQRGQLGAGRPVTRDIPVTVHGVVSPTMVAIGGMYSRGFTCATADGEFLCWGDNTTHQVSAEDGQRYGLPTAGAKLPAAVTSMAASRQRVCVLLENGSVRCWGPNFYGDLGDGTDMGSFEPKQVAGLTGGIKTLVGGSSHVCALSEKGKVSCWGDNSEGQLGTGDGQSANRPVTPAGLDSGVTALYGSDGGTCAQMEDGSFLCWGPNRSGLLGTGDEEVKPTPSLMALPDQPPVALAMGDSHTCALLEGGAAECWGSNYSGELGIGGVDVLTTTAAPVEGLPGPISSIHAGAQNTCAIVADGSLWCWGANSRGELGAGSAVMTSTVPLPVIGLRAGVTGAEVGAAHACAVLSDGELRCWGRDGDGELGIGTEGGIAAPQTVTALPVPELALHAVRGAPGSRFTLIGFNLPSDLPLTVTANGKVISPTLQTLGRGSLLAWIETASAEPGYYELAITSSDGISGSVPFSRTLHLVVDEAADLLEPGGGGVPVLTLPSGSARTIEEAPEELQQKTMLLLKAGVNLRSTPNGEILGKTSAKTEVTYDAGRALASPTDTTLPAGDGISATLQGDTAAGRVWLPVVWEGKEAWAADIVVERVSGHD